MRHRWLLVSLLSAVSSSVATAQTPAPRLGIFGGMTQAHVDGDRLSDISNRSGAAFGAYLVKPLAPNWSFQVGGMYTMKGWRRVEPDTHDEAEVRLNYIEIPALFRFDFAAPTSTGVYLFGGPGFGFRSTCELMASQGSTGLSNTISCEDAEKLGSPKFNSFDLTGVVGGGVRLPFGGKQLLLSAQYEHGFSDTDNGGRHTKTRTFTFGAGFEIPMMR